MSVSFDEKKRKRKMLYYINKMEVYVVTYHNAAAGTDEISVTCDEAGYQEIRTVKSGENRYAVIELMLAEASKYIG